MMLHRVPSLLALQRQPSLPGSLAMLHPTLGLAQISQVPAPDLWAACILVRLPATAYSSTGAIANHVCSHLCKHGVAGALALLAMFMST
jgi:hypothetical protein